MSFAGRPYLGMLGIILAILPGDTLYIRQELQPPFCVDARTMQDVPLERYDLVVADASYTPADAPMPVPGRVMRALVRLPINAHVVWLDERVLRVAKTAFMHEGIIGLSTSAGHRFRVVSIFRRNEAK